MGASVTPPDSPIDALGAKGLAALQVTRLEIAEGVGFYAGDRIGNLAQFEIDAVTQVIGRRSELDRRVRRKQAIGDIVDEGKAGFEIRAGFANSFAAQRPNDK